MTDWQKHIDFILDEFDFEKVHQVMECLNWTWGDDCDSPDGIPSLGDMRRHARKLLNEVTTSRNGFCACGGFAAERIENELLLNPSDEQFLRLVFEVEEMSSNLVEEQE